MRHVNFTELRNNLASHLDRLEQDRDELVVMRRNRDPVVIMTLADWESMKETLFLLSHPANRERLLKSIEELDAGEVVEPQLVDP